MGAWGLGLFQSDREYDLVADLSHEVGLNKLEDEAKAKARATQPPKTKTKTKGSKDDGEDSEDDIDRRIYYSLYANLCSDVPAVRKYLDNGALQTLIDKYVAKWRGPKSKNELYSPDYVLVMIGACAMSLGCKLPPGFKLLVQRLYQHVNLMSVAVQQMRDLLEVYNDGEALDCGSLGLHRTMEMATGPGINVHGKGTLFEPRVPAPKYPDEVCGSCGAKDGEGTGGALLACGKCKKRKYCSKDCQKIHWAVHKKACKAV